MIIPQERWRSKPAWAVLLLSIAAIAGYFCSKETVTIIEGIGAAVLLAAEAFGVFNNPTNKVGF